MTETTTRELEITIDTPIDEDPDPSYLDQEGFEDRRAQYDAGAFTFVGVRLLATITLVSKDGTSTWGNEVHVTSPGIWGVEDDSGADYFRELARDQYDYLVTDLIALGLPRELIEDAAREVLPLD